MPIPNYRDETAEDIPSRVPFELHEEADTPPPRVRFAENVTPHHEASRGLGQAFGLHPIPALTTLAVNAMLFGGTVLTLGALAPMAVIVASVLGYLTYRCQRSMYGDSHDAALVKSLAVSLITAIPVGLPAFLTVPSAVVGVVHTLRRKP